MNTVLITGGSRGIGKAIAIKFAQETEHHIVISYIRNKEAAEETAKIIEGFGNTCDILQFDVSIMEEVNASLEQWEKEHPDHVVSIIVNNAGINKDGLFMWMEKKDWKNVIDTSIHGFFHVSRFFVQKLLRKRYGRIINIVSLSGLKGNPGQNELFCSQGSGYFGH